MSVQDHLDALKMKHQVLDKQCAEGYSNFLADADLKKMKIQKAMVKAQIEQIENDME